MELIEGHKIEKLEDGEVVWRLSWKETDDGVKYDKKEEFLVKEE